MINSTKLALCAFAVLALSACSKEGNEDLPETSASAPASAPAADVQIEAPPKVPDADAGAIIPTTVSAAAVTVGAGQNGGVVTAKPGARFGKGETVYAGASTKGKPAGADLAVYWTFQDGRTTKQETRKLASGEQTVSFALPPSGDRKPGKYNVEIDVNMLPVGIADFVIE